MRPYGVFRGWGATVFALTAALAAAPAGYGEMEPGRPSDAAVAEPRAATFPRIEGTVPDEVGATVSLRVDLSARRLTVLENGEATRSYVIAIGKPGHQTPQGTYTIRRIQWNPSWVPPDREWARGLQARGPGDPRNPMGRVKIFFREPGYYIHGTPNEGSLGQAVSHGCIRMSNSDAIELARLLMAHGGADRPPSWFDRVLSESTRTVEVRLPRPIRLTVGG